MCFCPCTACKNVYCCWLQQSCVSEHRHYRADFRSCVSELCCSRRAIFSWLVMDMMYDVDTSLIYCTCMRVIYHNKAALSTDPQARCSETKLLFCRAVKWQLVWFHLTFSIFSSTMCSVYHCYAHRDEVNVPQTVCEDFI